MNLVLVSFGSFFFFFDIFSDLPMSTKRLSNSKALKNVGQNPSYLKIKCLNLWKIFWVRLDTWQVFHLPLAIQGTPCRRRFVWQTAQDRSWSNPELFPHQDNTDPSLRGIFSGNKVGHHMASTPWWVWDELKWRKQKKKQIHPTSRLLPVYQR